nr:immunoglobulin heavy chain junction region [Mus musculus]
CARAGSLYAMDYW